MEKTMRGVDCPRIDAQFLVNVGMNSTVVPP